MSTNIVVPELGESVVEATVAKWVKREGDRVEIGETVVELETEKIDLEVGTSQAGVLARVVRQVGEDVKIGEVLGVIDATLASADATAATPGGRPSPDRAAPTSPERAVGPPVSSPHAPPPPATGEPERDASPRATATARRIADAHEVDLQQVRGTGTAGRVTRQDIEHHLAAPGSEAPASVRDTGSVEAPASRSAGATPDAVGRREERVRMSRRRQTIARRLVEAQRTAAMLTTFNEVDMSAVLDLRRRFKESFRAQHEVGLGIVSFFLKASVVALKAYPRLNAEIQGDEMVLKHYFDIGVAVGASGGLVVPVLRDADRLSFAAIERGIKGFARKAEDGSLSMEDLRGGTFTITNGGVFGSLLSTPILNPPQVGILGLHTIQERAVPVASDVAIRPMMYVALSYDHRLVDGQEAVQFLVRIKEIVEDPVGLLLEE